MLSSSFPRTSKTVHVSDVCCPTSDNRSKSGEIPFKDLMFYFGLLSPFIQLNVHSFSRNSGSPQSLSKYIWSELGYLEPILLLPLEIRCMFCLPAPARFHSSGHRPIA